MRNGIKWFIRRHLPNVTLRIAHVEPGLFLRVGLRHHLGLIVRGAHGYEPRSVAILRRAVGHGDCVFDVGANIGFFTLLFSKWVGPAGVVHAFEPDPANHCLLCRNVTESGAANVACHAVALSDQAGWASFRRDSVTGSTGALGEAATYAEDVSGSARVTLLRVPTATIDGWSTETGRLPSLLKLDIEGGEHAALHGGLRTLREARPLVLTELSTWRDGIDAARECIELLSAARYALFDLDSGRPVDRGGAPPWMVFGAPAERLTEPRVAGVLALLQSRR